MQQTEHRVTKYCLTLSKSQNILYFLSRSCSQEFNFMYQIYICPQDQLLKWFHDHLNVILLSNQNCYYFHSKATDWLIDSCDPITPNFADCIIQYVAANN